MTAEQANAYLHALMTGITVGVILPAILLASLLGFVAIVLWAAQRRPDFDIADLLRDDSGRVSTWRFVSLMAFAIQSAYLYATLFSKADTELFAWYGVIWGGTPAAVILANRWNGALPFARGPQ